MTEDHQYSCALKHGNATLSLPTQVAAEEVGFVEEWFGLILNQLRRRDVGGVDCNDLVFHVCVDGRPVGARFKTRKAADLVARWLAENFDAVAEAVRRE